MCIHIWSRRNVHENSQPGSPPSIPPPSRRRSHGQDATHNAPDTSSRDFDMYYRQPHVPTPDTRIPVPVQNIMIDQDAYMNTRYLPEPKAPPRLAAYGHLEGYHVITQEKRKRAVEINVQITRCTTSSQILYIIQKNLDDFDPVAMSTALHRLGSLKGNANLNAQITSSPEYYRLLQVLEMHTGDLLIRNIANILWGLARLNSRAERLIMLLCEELKTTKMSQGLPQHISNCLWALSSLQYKPDDETMNSLKIAMLSTLNSFRSQNISNALLGFAKLGYTLDERSLELIAHAALDTLKDFVPQTFSNILWSLSRLGVTNISLMKKIAEASVPQIPQFAAQNVANAFWAFGNLGAEMPAPVLTACISRSIQIMNYFTAQHVSNVLWAMAKQNAYHEELFEAASIHALNIIDSFSPQSVANFLWAFATLDKPLYKNILETLMKHMNQCVKESGCQNICNVAWSLATLDKENLSQRIRDDIRLYFLDMSNEIQSRLMRKESEGDFLPQHLSNYAWAAATLEIYPGYSQLQDVLQSLAHRSTSLKPQECSNTLWACARLQHYDGQLMDFFADIVVERMDTFTCQNLANVVWSFAKLGHYSHALMCAAATSAEQQPQHLTNQHILNILWSYAILQFRSKESDHMMEVLIAEINRRMTSNDIDSLHLCNIVWSLSVSDHMSVHQWNILISYMEQKGNLEALPREISAQVFQAKMLMHARYPSHPWSMTPSFEAQAGAAWREATESVKVSEFHHQVSVTLKELQEQHSVEYVTKDSLFSIDIAFPEDMIAIEIDGPHHFTRNNLLPKGETVARNVIIASKGWHVLSIPYYKWPSDDRERQAYLKDLLSSAREKNDMMVS